MSDALFPSGEWVGFYNYQTGGTQFPMQLLLEFNQGRVTGSGTDPVGLFGIQGSYDPAACECQWNKTYVGAHTVLYRGFREGKGIWGLWEIPPLGRGGFHIWPLQSGQGETSEREEEKVRPKKETVRIAQPSKPARMRVR